MATRRNSVRAVAKKALAFKGMDEFQERLSKVVDAVSGPEMKDVMMRGAVIIANDARRRVRVKTGNLRGAIFASRGDENRSSVLVGVNFRKAPHAHLVEFGHGGPHPAPPYPFMRPAVESNAGRVEKIFRDGFGRILEKYEKK